MPVTKENRIYRTFMALTSLVIVSVLAGIFLNMAVRTRQLLHEEYLVQARLFFDSVLLMRKWNAEYGGVYVVKRPGVESNPYLQNPDVRTRDGRVLTLRNPALMTREISEYAATEGLYKFHITSLKLVNPDNRPDTFETEALRRFERGEAAEEIRIERVNERSIFRYMAPLYIEDSCLKCHSRQGYKGGEVRGGISVSFDIEEQERKLRSNILSISVFGVITTIALLGLIYSFAARMIRKLGDARRQIEKLAITDDLTGLYNRRHVLSRFVEEFEKVKRLKTRVSCIIADIDHFKAINDHYGHLIGDQVLKVISSRIRNATRAYDILGRYGGEEFLIVLPDTGPEDARTLAERMRGDVKEDPVSGTTITMSFGVTSAEEGDQSVDDIIKRADTNLYKAKHAGRDRVV
jgi:diguanylate cyclase (GGDEF)-like protein